MYRIFRFSLRLKYLQIHSYILIHTHSSIYIHILQRETQKHFQMFLRQNEKKQPLRERENQINSTRKSEENKKYIKFILTKANNK